MTLDGRTPTAQQKFDDPSDETIVEPNEVDAAPKEGGIDYSNPQVFEQTLPGQDDSIAAPFQIIDPLGVRVTRVSDKILFGTQTLFIPATAPILGPTVLLIPHHNARLRVTVKQGANLSSDQLGTYVLSHTPHISSPYDGWVVGTDPITFETRDAIYAAGWTGLTSPDAENNYLCSVQFAVELIAQ